MPIEVANLTHTYMKGTTSEVTAISGISFRIDDGEFVGLIGATGSGKSTLIQHLNGLLKPTSGKVMVDGVDIWSKGVSLKEVRRKIGLVFQYPEQQVFEEQFTMTCLWPRNLGYSQTGGTGQELCAGGLFGLLSRSLWFRGRAEGSHSRHWRSSRGAILDEPTAGRPKGRLDIDNIKRPWNGMTVILFPTTWTM